jgi:hypothetical protein
MEETKWYLADIMVEREGIETPAAVQYVLDEEELNAVQSYLKAIEDEDAQENVTIFAYAGQSVNGQGVSAAAGTMVFLPGVMTLDRAALLSDFTPPLDYDLAKATAHARRSPIPVIT